LQISIGNAANQSILDSVAYDFIDTTSKQPHFDFFGLESLESLGFFTSPSVTIDKAAQAALEPIFFWISWGHFCGIARTYLSRYKNF
jgi:hypothetical protein